MKCGALQLTDNATVTRTLFLRVGVDGCSHLALNTAAIIPDDDLEKGELSCNQIIISGGATPVNAEAMQRLGLNRRQNGLHVVALVGILIASGEGDASLAMLVEVVVGKRALVGRVASGIAAGLRNALGEE